jgi:hypothetical protein
MKQKGMPGWQLRVVRSLYDMESNGLNDSTVTQLFSNGLNEIETASDEYEETRVKGGSKKIKLRDSPFDYAVSYWLKHAMEVPCGAESTSLSKALWELVKEFFWDREGVTFQEWLRIFMPRNEAWHRTPDEDGFGCYRSLSDLDSKSDIRSCLHIAASYGLVDILQWSHPDGLDFDVRDITGRTPLMHAALVGDPNAVEAILSKTGVQVNQARCGSLIKAEDCTMKCGTLGGTALECAAWFRRLGVLKLLLRQPEIEIDLVSHGNSALGAAINTEFSQGIKLLVDAGAKLAKFGGEDEVVPSFL